VDSFPHHPALGHFDCVVLTAFDSEFVSIRNVFGLIGIRVHHAQTLEQADFLLLTTGSTVLLCDVAFVEGTWHSALELLRGTHPMIALVIVADPVDAPYLLDALTLGVCTILWKPLRFDEARRLVRTAHEAACERRLLLSSDIL